MAESTERRTRRRSRRRWVANALILVGIAVLLYPVGTWGYTYYQQRALETELERSHPALAADVESFFAEGLVGIGPTIGDLRGEKGDLLRNAREAESERTARLFRELATSFAEEVVGKGGTPIGKLQIPDVGIDVVIIQGTGTDDLREGPGHWPETPVPGLGGNFVVSGHRTTYGAPFFNLDELEKGDVIRVVLPYVAAEYEVTRTLIVSPRDVEVVKQRDVEEISLTTCHPIYSAAERLVVQAELTGFKLLEQPAMGSTATPRG